MNSTVHGNTGGNGGGIALYGASGKESKMTLVSCTVTGNTSLFVGGGVEFTPYTTMNVYNTVVSGNTAANGGDDLVGTNTALAATANLPAVLSYAVNGSVVYGAGKAVVAGSSFDPATMLGPLAGNGGPTQTCLLLGADSPARTLGMPYVDLSALGQDFDPQIGPEITGFDQTGLSREGTSAMGACVK